MTEPDDLETRWPRVVVRLVFGGMLIVVLYAISIGPAVALTDHRTRVNSWVGKVYSPVFWVARHTGFDRPLLDYISWSDRLLGGVLNPPIR